MVSGVVDDGKENFVVTIKNKEKVSAVLPLQEHWLPLSNLDLLLPPINFSVFFCYNNTKPNSVDSNGWMVNVLKKALAQTLVYYYAFASELVVNSVGEPELLCNNNGVEFIETYADIELTDLNLYNPDQTITGKLVPDNKHGAVLAIQVTELKCGGLVVGCTFDHRVADAYSANMFLVSWAETAHSKQISISPSFRRSLLNPRRPGSFDKSLNDMYVLVSSLPPPDESANDQLINRIYYVKAHDLNKLQSLASSSDFKRTKLESFSALLWKIVASSSDTKNKVSKMGIVVDGRTRLSNNKNNHKDKASMSTYFGNVLSIPYGGIHTNDLISKPLNWVANEIHGFLKESTTEEHFLGLIDWVEANRPEPALAKIYAGDKDDGPTFVVSSGQNFPVNKVNFGWGKPIFGSYHVPWGGNAGYVMPMPSATGNGDWVVYMHFTKAQIELIESEACHVFRPLTYDYLSNFAKN